MTVPASPDRIYEACLVELYKSMRAATFYHHGHPALAQSAQRTLRYFQNILQVVDRLEFTISRTQISIDDAVLKAQPTVLGPLARELFRRRVKKLIFLPGIELTDILGFIRAIKIEQSELVQRGGVEEVMAQLGVKSIWCNEVDFSRLDDVEEFQEDLEEEDEDAPGTDDDDTQEDLTEEQRTVRELLNRLLASDGNEFMRLLQEVVDQCRILAETQQYGEIALVLEGLLQCARDVKKDTTVRSYAEKAIRALAGKEVVRHVISELARCEDVRRDHFITILRYTGKVTVPFILTAMGDANDRLSRRNLTRAVTAFGPEAVPKTLEVLNDKRWYVVRNSLTILGEIGDVKLIPRLVTYLNHTDSRVAKEAVRTIWRSGGEAGIEALYEHLSAVVPPVQVHIVMLLGAIRWRQGREAIEDLALESHHEDVQVAACEALGKLAEPESFEVLSRLYKRKGLLKKPRSMPVRRAALQALVNYGGLSEPAMQDAMEQRDPKLQEIARLALERMHGSQLAPREEAHERRSQ